MKEKKSREGVLYITGTFLKHLNLFYFDSFSFLAADPPLSDLPCGIKPMARIVGGDVAIPHSWPWQAEILVKDQNSGQLFFKCGGTLVTPLYVVTAAHCVFQIPFAESYEIRLGEDGTNSPVSQ